MLTINLSDIRYAVEQVDETLLPLFDKASENCYKEYGNKFDLNKVIGRVHGKLFDILLDIKGELEELSTRVVNRVYY